MSILVNEWGIEPTVVKKANQFSSFKFGDLPLLDTMNFLGGATSLDSYLKPYKTSETKRFFPYEWFDHRDKLQNTELPPYDAFYTKVRSWNPFEAKYRDHANVLKSGLTTEQAIVKLKLSKPTPTGIANYQNLHQIWKQEQMSSFKDFLRCYSNKDVVPTLAAMQKMITFYHDKDIDMLKLGSTLPKLATICLHKPTEAKFYPFTEGVKTFWKNFQNMFLVVNLSFLHAKQLLMKLLFGSQQMYANLLLEVTPANYIPTRCVNPHKHFGITIQKKVDSQPDKTRPTALKIWSCPISNKHDKNVKLKTSLQQADRHIWLLQCWWVWFSLQYCVWSNGLLLSLLFLSRAASLSHWRGFSTR